MVQRIVPILLVTVLAACDTTDNAAPEPGGGPDEAPGAAAATQHEGHEASAATQTNAAAFARKPAPQGATAYIISPADGDTVTNPVRIVFGLKGMGVAPAGVAREDAGHHHLLIDTDPPAFDTPIPADDRHVHFGLGQTETTLTLSPGEHRLQLLLGDELHVPHEPPLLSEPITIQVR